MCSIMGYAGEDIPMERLLQAFGRSMHRGPDCTRAEKLPHGSLLFHRLAIMGLEESGMQPFWRGKCAVACNGELYGFRKLKMELEQKGYCFESGSDCELLLPLYEEYGLSMFARLDAEFALILYDEAQGGLVAARDPIGIRPLYYGYSESGGILFASEPACLLRLVKTILPFPPGHYYANGVFTCYCDIAEVKEYCHDDLDIICCGIRERLTAGVKKRLDADAPLGFLLSGGLDSSLVCAIAAQTQSKPIRTFAIGMREDAIDLKYAREAASYIQSEHAEVLMTKEDVLGALEEVVRTLGTYDITTIRASIGMYLLCKAIRRHTNIRVLLTGEISDELFGYKYTDFAPSPAAFQQEAQKRLRELHLYDVLRADRCISAHAIEARVPFGDLAFVRYVMAIAPELKMNTYNKGKYLLRRAFAGGYLPESILQREKAAFSDAVGHSMVDILKAHAESVISDKAYQARRARYAHARPFTKESLLYRELFEKHYPGQSAMISDYWMPNKEWEGCNVDDPSARVLANYGASGL